MDAVSAKPACDRRGKQALRIALVSSVALAMLAAMVSSADAARRSRYKAAKHYYYQHSYYKHGYKKRRHKMQAVNKASPEKEGFAEMPKDGVLQVGISIGSQRVTVFRDGKRIVQGPISSGTASHPTPMGVFSVIEKDRHHRSNIYSAAPMPFMQRITWSGVAMHEGVLPGYPASHGCIRLTRDFAARLWLTTRLGVRVIVSRHEIAPAEFEHPSLFAPKPKPAEPPVAMLDPADAGKPGLRVHLAEATQIVRDAVAAEMPPATSEPVKPVAPAVADDRKPADLAIGLEPKPLDDGSAAEKPRAAAADDDTVKSTGAITPPRQDAVAAPPDLRKAVEIPAVAEPAAAAPAVADKQPGEAAEAAPPAEAAVKREDAVKPAPDDAEARKLTAPRYKRAEQPPKRNGQVSVFVSRKEKKIFVRQGFVPLFEMPIVIEDADRPLGTHVFTALGMREDGSGMRWNVITVNDPIASEHRQSKRRKSGHQAKPVVENVAPPPTDAKDALDRIRMPKEAVDRIGELLVPGSSLVVSDQGMSYETGRGTEFIVLTR
jgi:lipoprotein-anchoring transpeptidase ErfK/SrfK